MKYEEISPYWVIDEIKKGKKVYVLDRKLKNVASVNEATVQDVVTVIKSEEDGRYVFWYEEEEPKAETETENA
jgi:hypothetical protein